MLQSQTRPSLTYHYARGASLGQRRRQEDHCLMWTAGSGSASESGRTGTGLLVVLADGMGGHVSGETASRAACEGYIQAFSHSSVEMAKRLDTSLDKSNQALKAAIKSDPSLDGMGSTIVAAFIDADGLRWASVGDSTLMLFRDGVLRRLNADHSHGAILDEQAAAGIISEEVAKADTRRRALHSALTGHAIPLRDVETQPITLEPGDWIVVASDGIFTLTGDEIATAIDSNAQSDPIALTAHLISAVNAKNVAHQDNTTIAVINVVHSDTDAPSMSVAAGDMSHSDQLDERTKSLPVFGKTTIAHDTDGRRRSPGGWIAGLLLLIVAIVATALFLR